jgi:uncharacterized protein (DUF433 family)
MKKRRPYAYGSTKDKFIAHSKCKKEFEYLTDAIEMLGIGSRRDTGYHYPDGYLPHIRDKKVAVHSIAFFYNEFGMGAKAISEELGTITEEEAQAALDYYKGGDEYIDLLIKAQYVLADMIMKQMGLI